MSALRTPARGRRVVLLSALASLCVAIPFMGWQATWFGRRLSESEIGRYLDDAKPRKVQHALSQISDRIQQNDPAVQRWYPRVVELSRSPLMPIRNTVAWVMGQDNRSEAFHAALRAMLRDPEPLVRRNAALALVRFHDASGRPELIAMLGPYHVRAPVAGTVSVPVRIAGQVGGGTLVAQVRQAGGQTVDVHAPFPGEVAAVAVRDGYRVAAGAPLLTVQSDSSQVWEALRALYLVGEPEDLPEIERRAAGTPDPIRQQATLTARAIRTRSERSPNR